MKVYVKLFANLVQLVPEQIRERYPQGIRAGTPIEVELPQASTLADLVDYLALPRDKVRIVYVDGRAKTLDYRLAAGNEVGMFPPIGGG
jgi:molybdopterin synthase sulfur carrier subunit